MHDFNEPIGADSYVPFRNIKPTQQPDQKLLRAAVFDLEATHDEHRDLVIDILSGDNAISVSDIWDYWFLHYGSFEMTAEAVVSLYTDKEKLIRTDAAIHLLRMGYHVDWFFDNRMYRPEAVKMALMVRFPKDEDYDCPLYVEDLIGESTLGLIAPLYAEAFEKARAATNSRELEDKALRDAALRLTAGGYSASDLETVSGGLERTLPSSLKLVRLSIIHDTLMMQVTLKPSEEDHEQEK